MPGNSGEAQFPVSLNISIDARTERYVLAEVERRRVSKSTVIRDFMTHGIDTYFGLVEAGEFPDRA